MARTRPTRLASSAALSQAQYQTHSGSGSLTLTADVDLEAALARITASGELNETTVGLLIGLLEHELVAAVRDVIIDGHGLRRIAPAAMAALHPLEARFRAMGGSLALRAGHLGPPDPVGPLPDLTPDTIRELIERAEATCAAATVLVTKTSADRERCRASRSQIAEQRLRCAQQRATAGAFRSRLLAGAHNRCIISSAMSKTGAESELRG